MYFYDQDIVMTKYAYTNNFTVEMNVIMNLPGIGIVLSEYEDDNPFNTNNTYLLKVGNNNMSIFNKRYAKQERLYNVSCVMGTRENTLQKIILDREGRILTMSTMINDNKILLGRHTFSDLPDSLYIGFYSNKRNTIQDVLIYDECPELWLPNIKNTNGGRISFKRDTIKIEECKYDAEVEHENIPIFPGKYYIDYETDNKEDTSCFIFNSNESENIDAEDKNLINYEDNSFHVKENCNINILFRGKNCEISNICIKENSDGAYVSTDESSAHIDGSYIKIDIEKIKSIKMSCLVDSVPEYELNEQIPYAIFTTGDRNDTLEDYGMSLNEKYVFDIDVFNNAINNTTTGFSRTIEDDKTLYILKNVSGYIDELILTYLDGTVINVLIQTTIKKYVTDNITSPILVLDDNDNPLDLSSSYRYCTQSKKYIFTNWEREYFDTTSRSIILANKASDTAGSIYVYGVYNTDYDMGKLYDITSPDNIHSVELFSSEYDSITENVFAFSDGRVINFPEDIINKYSLIVIEYLKDDSYAINHIDSQYEVDISTSNEIVEVCYDMTEGGEIQEYKILEVSPSDDKYVVLRK